MADYSEVDANDARRVIEGLMESRDSQDLLVDDSVVISDIERDVANFLDDLRILEDIGVDMPGIRLGDEAVVPVALSELFGLAGISSPSARYPLGALFRRNPYWYEAIYDVLNTRDLLLPEFEQISREQARATFRNRAVDFLATRVSAVRGYRTIPASRWFPIPLLTMLQRSGGRQIPTPGCNFTISTNSTGLRVFWSGAYRISSNYFSHPTTPTTSVLQSGTYVFGVDGGAYGSQIQWDQNAIVSLPGSPNAHLNF